MIIPAILEKDIEKIRERVAALANAATLIQIDVLESAFTDIEKLDALKTSTQFEIHLMVKNPLDFLNNKVEKATRIIAHVESQNVTEFIKKAKGLGYQVGLAINPETPLEALSPYMGRVDFVQFMTVIPGAQGREFQINVLDKIGVFRTCVPKVPIQVDGGVDETLLPRVLQAGATNVVIGSQIYQSPKDSLEHFKEEEAHINADLTARKSARKIRSVAFLGGAEITGDNPIWATVFETAKLLAQNGYEIINGGGPGVMEAATKGAHAGGGKVLAVTYHTSYKHKNYEGVYSGNDFDKEVVTLDYFDRTKVMLQNSDLHIIFKGGTGTISEFGMSWASSRIHEGHHKPIILFGTFWNHIIGEFKKHMLLRTGEASLLKIASGPQEVLDYVKGLS